MSFLYGGIRKRPSGPREISSIEQDTGYKVALLRQVLLVERCFVQWWLSLPKEEQSVCEEDEEEVLEEVVGQRLLGGRRLFFNTLSGLPLPEVSL